MADPDFLQTLAFVLLAGLDVLAAAIRAAMFNATLARLLALPEERQPAVSQLLALLTPPHRLRASLHLFQSILRFLLAGLVLLFLLPAGSTFQNPWLAFGFLVITSLVLFLLEWGVAAWIASKAEEWSLRLLPAARLLVLIASPFVLLPLRLTNSTEGLGDGTPRVTETEIKTLMDAGQQEGVLEQGERKMIFSIFRLGDTLAREIMVPRIDVLAFEIHTPLEEAVDALLQSGYSRVPVYEETIENIRGLIYTKDLLKIWREGGRFSTLAEISLRPVHFVPEAKKVDGLLAEMQAQRIHMSVVVDEYGGVAGIVTLEDIVEEIVGEIQDEYDQVEDQPYQVLDSHYLFQGRIDLDDFNEIMDVALPKDEAETLGGFIYSQIGRVPTGGESVTFEDLKLTVELVSGRRIRKVRAERIAPPSKNGDEPNHVNG